jgi:two-component system, cell cycle response regulator
MKILISTHSEEQEEHLTSLLIEDGYRVAPLRNGRSALSALQEADGPRIAVLDELMPELNAEEVCRKIRASGMEHYTYCIVRVPSADRDTRDRVFEAGADDVIAMRTDYEELSARLRNAKRVINLQEQLLAAREALRFETTHDGATGVFNRQGIGDHLRREFERASRFGKSLGIVMIDLDHFRIINDSFGYHAGDMVLREVASRIKTAVRAYDVVGRYGADEFVILSPEITSAALVAQAERVLTAVSSQPVCFDGQQILLTASIGVAISDDRSSNELVQAAEDAAERAKQTGRNCVEFARTSCAEQAFAAATAERPYSVN